MNKYEVKIVNALLKKYYKRKAIHKDAEIHRRIDFPVTKILKEYSDYNVKLDEKELVNTAIASLAMRGFITASKLKFSDDYEKLYLVEDNIADLEDYAAKELEILPRSFVVDEVMSVIKKFKGKNKITDFYIADLENKMNNSSAQIDGNKEEDTLKMLSFLENNATFLYVREASMIVFGDSKHFENSVKSSVSSIISNYLIENCEEIFEDENLLERFNVYDADQDICIKGPVSVIVNGKCIDLDGLDGGISFSIKDIDKIENITVNSNKVMTVENKTSFLRMGGDCCYIYLGGFATKPQILFIKKLIADNPEKEYLHFGDIDAGGFLIHKKLCEETCLEFKLFNMESQCLKNKKYRKCLKHLTANDITRLVNIAGLSEYSECIEYMLENNVKLEQEIISLDISGEDSVKNEKRFKKQIHQYK